MALRLPWAFSLFHFGIFFNNLTSLLNPFPTICSQRSLGNIPQVKVLYFISSPCWILCPTEEEMGFSWYDHTVMAPSAFARGEQGGDSMV